MEQRKWYVGIDLGTTNSNLSYAQVGFGGRIMPVTLSFDQYDMGRQLNRAELLPSFVYFEPGRPEPTLGRYAKYDGMRAQPHRVAHSFKLDMGDPTWRFRIEEDDIEYTATELSHYVLKTLMKGFHQLRQTDFRQAIVTVPASFKTDPRAATEEAARMAEIDLIQLLDEPKAALLAYINQLQSEGAFDDRDDLFDNKTLLVYDLGGGTLDISIHRVRRNPESPFLGVEIEDKVVTRFTELGGDHFDRKIADYLLNYYTAQYENLCETEEQRDELLVILTQHAEQLKCKLSNSIRDHGKDIEADRIVEPGVFNRQALEPLSISAEQYEEIVAPLLGREFSLDDLKHSDQAEAEVNQYNLIVPLLDVLSKFREKTQNPEALPDAVIFHGGMSRAWFVQNRLRRFFESHPIKFEFVGDPDRACSQGACLLAYHLLEHGQDRFVIQIARSIVSDTYRLRLEEGYHTLIESGDEIPKETEVVRGKFILRANHHGRLTLPIEVGEGTRWSPRRDIYKRHCKLEPAPEGDTPVDVEYSMDINKTLSFKAIFPELNIEPISFEVYDRSTKEREPHEEKESLPLDLVDEIIRIASYSTSWSKDEPSCVKIEREIRLAGNRSEFFEYVVKQIRLLTLRIDKIGHRPMRAVKRLSILLGNLVDGVEEELHGQALTVLHNLCNNVEDFINFGTLPPERFHYYQNEVLQNVVTTIGKIGNQISEHILRFLIETKDITRSLRIACVIPLGKVGHSDTLFDFLAANLLCPKNVTGRARHDYRAENWRLHVYWAIAKAANGKANEPPIPPENLMTVKNTLKKQLKQERTDHRETLRNLFWAVGEVFEHYGEGKEAYVPNPEDKQRFLKALKTCYDNLSFEHQLYLKTIYGTVKSQIQGLRLTPEQQKLREYLLALADKNE